MTPDQVCAYWALEGLAPDLLPILHELVAEGFVYHYYAEGNDYALSNAAYAEKGIRGIHPRKQIDLDVFHRDYYAIAWADASLDRLTGILLDIQENQT